MKASIVTATHNRPRLLKKAVDSVLNQSHEDWELIISNDGDPIPESYITKDPRITLIDDGPSSYYTENRNRAVAQATGDILVTLDDDNWIGQDFLKSHIAVHKTKDVGVTYSGRVLVLPDGEFINGPIPVFKGETETLNGIIDAGDIVYKRALVKDGYPPEKDRPGYCSDMRLLDKVLKENRHIKVVRIDRHLHYYLHHDDSMTMRKVRARQKGELVDEEQWTF